MMSPRSSWPKKNPKIPAPAQKLEAKGPYSRRYLLLLFRRREPELRARDACTCAGQHKCQQSVSIACAPEISGLCRCAEGGGGAKTCRQSLISYPSQKPVAILELNMYNFFFPPQLSFPYIRVCKLQPCGPPDDSSWALEWVLRLLFSISAFQQLTSAVLNAENSAQNNDGSVPARLTPYLLLSRLYLAL